MFETLSAHLAALILAFAALAKALHARPALAALRRAVTLPDRIAVAALLAVIGSQTALAVLLLSPHRAMAAALGLALTTTLLLVNLIARRRGRLADCGCYGAFPWMSSALSWTLDGLLLFALALALTLATGSGDGNFFMAIGAGPWIATAVGTALACAYLAHLSLLQGRLLPRPLLRPTRPWPALARNHSLTGGQGGRHYTVFISEHCPQCGRMVHALKTAQGLGLLPPTSLVMAEGQSLFHSPIPVVNLPLTVFHRLAESVPLVVISTDGVVEEIRQGTLPAALVEALRQGRRG